MVDEVIALTHIKGSLIDDLVLDGNEVNEKALDHFRVLKKERKKLRDILAASICECASCSESEKDHIYNPVDQKWYCESFYNVIVVHERY